MARRRRSSARPVAVAVVLALLATFAGLLPAPSAGAGPSSSDWLGELNLMRSLAGLPPVANEPAWSARNVEHARWMVYNDQVYHGAIPGTPWYTAGADLAGQRSNLFGGSEQRSNRDAIDGWMSVPFHGIGLLDPAIDRVGFGSYYDASDTGLRWGAGLDIVSDVYAGGTPPPAPTYPVVWPGNGSVTHLTRFGGNEYPDPLTSCPGLAASSASAPMFALFASSSGSVSSVTLRRTSDGASLPLCWFDGTTYANPDGAAQSLGRSVLANRKAVVVMARSPHEVGQSYELTVVRGGVTARSRFSVGLASSPHDPKPFGSLSLVQSPQRGKVRVGGWAADRDAPTSPVTIHVYVDAVGTSIGPADRPRPDVAAIWPELGPDHGFDATIDAAPGLRRVCVYAIGIGEGGNTKLGCVDLWVPDPLSPFLDVLSTSTFFDDIVWMAEAGITTGYADGTFRPAGTVQRQAMAAFLYRFAGSPQGEDPACRVAPFSDVPTSHPFCGEIAWLATSGITTGYKDGTFRPTVGVERQAMAAYLYRYAGSPDGEAPSCEEAPFADVPVTQRFCGEIAWLATTGITTGYPDGTFRPGLLIQRQAMAAYLHRFQVALG